MKRVEAPELLACPWCSSSEINFILLPGRKQKVMACTKCGARGPVCPHELKHEPINETTAAAKSAWNARAPSPQIAGLVSALEASDGMSIGPNGSGGTKVLINFADHVPAGKLFSLLSDLSALATFRGEN